MIHAVSAHMNCVRETNNVLGTLHINVICYAEWLLFPLQSNFIYVGKIPQLFNLFGVFVPYDVLPLNLILGGYFHVLCGDIDKSKRQMSECGRSDVVTDDTKCV